MTSSSSQAPSPPSKKKTILITGASRGIGLAIAKSLIKQGHDVFAVARDGDALEKLKNEAPEGRVSILKGDVSDDELAEKAVSSALAAFNSIDGLILNHGTLEPVKRISDSTASEWRSAFDVNFFSLIPFIQAALPALRKSKGSIILTSSGASAAAYSTWGAYGSSKAAMNHLALTLAVEEPSITTLSIRPGVVDTDMQALVRSKSSLMDAKDVEKFKSLYEGGKLVKAEDVGRVMARLSVGLGGEEGIGKELNGKFLSWDSEELKGFR